MSHFRGPVRNIALTISYDGSDFRGWQTQPHQRTVQETLERAIKELTQAADTRLTASGRTDSGVHAVGQVATFMTDAPYPPAKIVRALNARLPEDVVIRRAIEVPPEFCANRSAKRKLYRYVMHDAATPDPFLRRFAHHLRVKLDAAAMRRASRCLVGKHDFRSFETEWPNRASSVRTITHLGVSRAGDYLWVDVEADGFLYNMVRSIVGTLIDVGRGYSPESRVAEVLTAEDRNVAGPTAPAHGLFLMRVSYESDLPG